MKYSILRGFIVIGVMAAFSTVAKADHRWSIYHWATDQKPIILQVVDSVTPDWQAEMDESIAAWNLSTELSMVVTSANDRSRIRKRCKMQSGQVRICNASYGGTGWLGIATIGITSGDGTERVIVEGSVKINDFYSSYWTDQSKKNHVMCQEIGHIHGIDHTSTDGTSQCTCMDYSCDQNSQWPNAHDYELLDDIIYNHLDSFNSYDDGISDPVADEPCNAPPGKGCNKNTNAGPTPMGVLVHSDRAYQLWVARRPGGGLWIHHVRLAVKGDHGH